MHKPPFSEEWVSSMGLPCVGHSMLMQRVYVLHTENGQAAHNYYGLRETEKCIRWSVSAWNAKPKAILRAQKKKRDEEVLLRGQARTTIPGNEKRKTRNRGKQNKKSMSDRWSCRY